MKRQREIEMARKNIKRKLQVLQQYEGQFAALEQKLNRWLSRFNPFVVLTKTYDEHCHSNVLAWLLDARKEHGLDDAFFSHLLGRFLRSSRGRSPLRAKQFSIYREEGYIDILAVSDEKPRTVIAIENKVRSREHGKQLLEYHGYLDERYHAYKKVFILLSPEGTPPKADGWAIMTYADVAKALETAMSEKRADIPSPVRTFLNDYLTVVRRDVLMDSKLKSVCNRIYREHKEVLDLIFDNFDNSRTRLGEAMDKAFNALNQESFRRAETSGNGMLGLQSSQIDKILKSLPEAIGSWGTQEAYRFWIAPDRSDDARLVGHFEIGLWHIPAQNKRGVEQLKNIFKKNKTKSRYCRLGKQISADIGDAYEDDKKYYKTIKRAVSHIIEGFEALEQKIYKGLNTAASPR
jgi:hypothetical protein